jgi:hypothetical protein
MQCSSVCPKHRGHNVKADVTPHATGDGHTPDNVAINAALTRATPSHSPVYFPPAASRRSRKPVVAAGHRYVVIRCLERAARR